MIKHPYFFAIVFMYFSSIEVVTFLLVLIAVVVRTTRYLISLRPTDPWDFV